jgi:hypothetical protein
MIGAVTPAPGGLGAGRLGCMPFARMGIGGGARGFSKLSAVLLGKRGLGGIVCWVCDICGVSAGDTSVCDVLMAEGRPGENGGWPLA